MCDVLWNALPCSTAFRSIVKHLAVKLCSRFHFPQYKFLIFPQKIKRKVARNCDALDEQGNFFLTVTNSFDCSRKYVRHKKKTSCILILNWNSFPCSHCTFCYLRFLPTLSFLPPSYHYVPFIHPRCSNVWTIFAPFNLSFSWSISRSFFTLPLYSFLYSRPCAFFYFIS